MIDREPVESALLISPGGRHAVARDVPRGARRYTAPTTGALPHDFRGGTFERIADDDGIMHLPLFRWASRLP